MGRDRRRTRNRGQAHTLEGFMAALIVVSGVLFALGATAVTPLSASTSNQHIQNQQLSTANSLLATADGNGTLRDAIVYWNTSERDFYGAESQGYYIGHGPPIPFWNATNETFLSERVAVNIYVIFWDGNSRQQRPMMYMGSPSDNAVRASRSVTLYNDTRISAPDENGNVSDAWAAGNFYAPDIAPGDELYNVVEVRITAWRM